MAELNEQLATIARNVIREMREESWPEDDILWSTCGALLKHLEAQGTIGDDPSKYDMAAIQTLVKQVMKEPQESALVRCVWCGNMHQAEQVEQCPLKPGRE